MPGFWYCLRNRQPEDMIRDGHLVRGELRQAGLGEILDDVSDVPDHCIVSGPAVVSGAQSTDEAFGVVIYPKAPAGSDPSDWKYNGSQQTWVPWGDGSAVWIGWQTSSPPQPEDLARRKQLPGHPVTDRAGRQWTVPIARSQHGRSGLPADFVRTAGGVETVVSEPYLPLWELSGSVRDWIFDRHVPENQPLWKYDTALQILAANYRIGPQEANLLQQFDCSLLNTDTIDTILLHFIDWEMPEELLRTLQKKTEPAATDS